MSVHARKAAIGEAVLHPRVAARLIKELKGVRRGRISEYADHFKNAEFHEGARPWNVPSDLAMPCATQNEISEMRPEATGYGAVYFLEDMLHAKGEAIEGKSVVISGSGNVATFAAEKVIHRDGMVLTLSDSGGFIYDKDGIDARSHQGTARCGFPRHHGDRR